MARELPNLDWLRVFAACADAGSFALAAERLGVTAGAVSQRVKALEDFLAATLFERLPRGVRLTPAGRRYADEVRPAVEQLLHATRALPRAEALAPVRVTILPALAQLWLGARLASFHRQHEGVSIEIWADPAPVDLRAGSFDLAIRYGRAPFAGCDDRPFLLDELVPVASPALLTRCRRDAGGLPLGAPLLVDTYWSGDFGDWLRATDQPSIAPPATQTFSLYSMVIDATLTGQGFTIGHTALLGDLLADGRLVALSDQRVRAANQFHLLTPQKRTLTPWTAQFLDWLEAQGGRS